MRCAAKRFGAPPARARHSPPLTTNYAASRPQIAGALAGTWTSRTIDSRLVVHLRVSVAASRSHVQRSSMASDDCGGASFRRHAQTMQTLIAV